MRTAYRYDHTPYHDLLRMADEMNDLIGEDRTYTDTEHPRPGPLVNLTSLVQGIRSKVEGHMEELHALLVKTPKKVREGFRGRDPRAPGGGAGWAGGPQSIW